LLGSVSDLTDILVIVFLPIVAVIYATPKQLRALREAGIPFPIQDAAAILQGSILCALGAGLGFALRGTTGFDLLGSSDRIGPGAVIALFGFLGHLFLYYIVFRPRLLKASTLLSEKIRLEMGILARVLQGGFAEEVQFRWGLMSLAVWLGTLFFPSQVPALIASAIAISAVLFGVFHLIGARQIGLARENMEAMMIVADNTWGGIVFGWLFWKYGLAAAMLCHALFHVAWFPIEIWIHRRG
jgi:Type II CAAX prenyl endopeptidase Rce1-like